MTNSLWQYLVFLVNQSRREANNMHHKVRVLFGKYKMKRLSM